MNRVTAAIKQMRQQIEDRIASGITTPEQVEETSLNLDMYDDEIANFKSLTEIAVSTGKLTDEERKTIVKYLGDGEPDHFNSQPVEVKAVLTQYHSELLKAVGPVPRHSKVAASVPASPDGTRSMFLTFDANDDETTHIYEVRLREHEGKYSVSVSLDTLKDGIPASSNTESMPYLARTEETLEQAIVYYDAYVANILKSAKAKGWTLTDRVDNGDRDDER
jgi:hypothetical protein